MPPRSAASYKDALAPFERAQTRRAVVQLTNSLLPYLALTAASYLTWGLSPLLTAVLAVLAGGFLVRTFVVFHDCSHGSLLPSRKGNARVGAVLGLFVLTPFAQWRHGHAIHHATSGDLDRRGVGDVLTLTVAEYQAQPWYGRLGYRLFRNPLVMFGLGPIFAMIILPRVAGIGPGSRRRLRNSVLLNDAVLAVIFFALGSLLGWVRFLEIWAPSAMLAGAAGIWLFYVQHQFEDAYWVSGAEWSYAEAALAGSTHLRLPRVLAFFSADIGYHHVHHLNAKIPNYNLRKAHASHPVFESVPTIGIADGMRAVRFKLWDADAGKLVSFAKARRSSSHARVAAGVVGAEA
jgi:omega-6 fatty acid desaturase (delta-12 desaturase)